MSWKGFTKAISRLPHMILQKTGVADGAHDGDFDELHKRYLAAHTITNRLSDDLSRYRDILRRWWRQREEVLHQWVRVMASRTLSNDMAKNGAGIRSKSGKNISRANDLEIDVDLASLIQKEVALGREMLAVVETHLGPSSLPLRVIGELLALQKAIDVKITKRAHKLLDYDRHSSEGSLFKLKSQRSKESLKEVGSTTDERKLMKKEEAQFAYESLNEQLKDDLPRFLFAHQQLMQIIATCLIRLMVEMHELCAEQGEALDSYPAVIREFDESHVKGLEAISSIAMVRRMMSGISSNTNKGVGIDRTTNGPTKLASAKVDYPQNSSIQQDRLEEDDSKYASHRQAKPSRMTSVSSLESEVKLDANKIATRTLATGIVKKMPATSPTDVPVAPIQIEKTLPVNRNPSGSRVAALAAKLETTQLQPHRPLSSIGGLIKTYAVAVYDFKAIEETDLSFCAGMRIEIIQKTDKSDDWWVGRIGNRQGTFPGTYVAIQ